MPTMIIHYTFYILYTYTIYKYIHKLRIIWKNEKKVFKKLYDLIFQTFQSTIKKKNE